MRTRTSKGQVRRTPQRTCAACRRTGDQSSFIRLVRVGEGSEVHVEVDEGRRRVAGRGAYLCPDRDCWERGLGGALSGSLRMQLSTANREALRAYAARFAQTPSEAAVDGEPPHEREGEAS